MKKKVYFLLFLLSLFGPASVLLSNASQPPTPASGLPAPKGTITINNFPGNIECNPATVSVVYKFDYRDFNGPNAVKAMDINALKTAIENEATFSIRSKAGPSLSVTPQGLTNPLTFSAEGTSYIATFKAKKNSYELTKTDDHVTVTLNFSIKIAGTSMSGSGYQMAFLATHPNMNTAAMEGVSAKFSYDDATKGATVSVNFNPENITNATRKPQNGESVLKANNQLVTGKWASIFLNFNAACFDINAVSDNSLVLAIETDDFAYLQYLQQTTTDPNPASSTPQDLNKERVAVKKFNSVWKEGYRGFALRAKPGMPDKDIKFKLVLLKRGATVNTFKESDVLYRSVEYTIKTKTVDVVDVQAAYKDAATAAGCSGEDKIRVAIANYLPNEGGVAIASTPYLIRLKLTDPSQTSWIKINDVASTNGVFHYPINLANYTENASFVEIPVSVTNLAKAGTIAFDTIAVVANESATNIMGSTIVHRASTDFSINVNPGAGTVMDITNISTDVDNPTIVNGKDWTYAVMNLTPGCLQGLSGAKIRMTTTNAQLYKIIAAETPSSGGPRPGLSATEVDLADNTSVIREFHNPLSASYTGFAFFAIKAQGVNSTGTSSFTLDLIDSEGNVLYANPVNYYVKFQTVTIESAGLTSTNSPWNDAVSCEGLESLNIVVNNQSVQTGEAYLKLTLANAAHASLINLNELVPTNGAYYYKIDNLASGTNTLSIPIKVSNTALNELISFSKIEVVNTNTGTAEITYGSAYTTPLDIQLNATSGMGIDISTTQPIALTNSEMKEIYLKLTAGCINRPTNFPTHIYMKITGGAENFEVYKITVADPNNPTLATFISNVGVVRETGGYSNYPNVRGFGVRVKNIGQHTLTFQLQVEDTNGNILVPYGSTYTITSDFENEADDNFTLNASMDYGVDDDDNQALSCNNQDAKLIFTINNKLKVGYPDAKFLKFSLNTASVALSDQITVGSTTTVVTYNNGVYSIPVTITNAEIQTIEIPVAINPANAQTGSIGFENAKIVDRLSGSPIQTFAEESHFDIALDMDLGVSVKATNIEVGADGNHPVVGGAWHPVKIETLAGCKNQIQGSIYLAISTEDADVMDVIYWNPIGNGGAGEPKDLLELSSDGKTLYRKFDTFRDLAPVGVFAIRAKKNIVDQTASFSISIVEKDGNDFVSLYTDPQAYTVKLQTLVVNNTEMIYADMQASTVGCSGNDALKVKLFNNGMNIDNSSYQLKLTASDATQAQYVVLGGINADASGVYYYPINNSTAFATDGFNIPVTLSAAATNGSITFSSVEIITGSDAVGTRYAGTIPSIAYNALSGVSIKVGKLGSIAAPEAVENKVQLGTLGSEYQKVTIHSIASCKKETAVSNRVAIRMTTSTPELLDVKGIQFDSEGSAIVKTYKTFRDLQADEAFFEIRSKCGVPDQTASFTLELVYSDVANNVAEETWYNDPNIYEVNLKTLAITGSQMIYANTSDNTVDCNDGNTFQVSYNNAVGTEANGCNGTTAYLKLGGLSADLGKLINMSSETASGIYDPASEAFYIPFTVKSGANQSVGISVKTTPFTLKDTIQFSSIEVVMAQDINAVVWGSKFDLAASIAPIVLDATKGISIAGVAQTPSGCEKVKITVATAAGCKAQSSIDAKSRMKPYICLTSNDLKYFNVFDDANNLKSVITDNDDKQYVLVRSFADFRNLKLTDKRQLVQIQTKGNAEAHSVSFTLSIVMADGEGNITETWSPESEPITVNLPADTDPNADVIIVNQLAAETTVNCEETPFNVQFEAGCMAGANAQLVITSQTNPVVDITYNGSDLLTFTESNGIYTAMVPNILLNASSALNIKNLSIKANNRATSSTESLTFALVTTASDNNPAGVAIGKAVTQSFNVDVISGLKISPYVESKTYGREVSCSYANNANWYPILANGNGAYNPACKVGSQAKFILSFTPDADQPEYQINNLFDFKVKGAGTGFTNMTDVSVVDGVLVYATPITLPEVSANFYAHIRAKLIAPKLSGTLHIALVDATAVDANGNPVVLATADKLVTFNPEIGIESEIADGTHVGGDCESVLTFKTAAICGSGTQNTKLKLEFPGNITDMAAISIDNSPVSFENGIAYIPVSALTDAQEFALALVSKLQTVSSIDFTISLVNAENAQLGKSITHTVNVLPMGSSAVDMEESIIASCEGTPFAINTETYCSANETAKVRFTVPADIANKVELSFNDGQVSQTLAFTNGAAYLTGLKSWTSSDLFFTAKSLSASRTTTTLEVAIVNSNNEVRGETASASLILTPSGEAVYAIAGLEQIGGNNPVINALEKEYPVTITGNCKEGQNARVKFAWTDAAMKDKVRFTFNGTELSFDNNGVAYIDYIVPESSTDTLKLLSTNGDVKIPEGSFTTSLVDINDNLLSNQLTYAVTVTVNEDYIDVNDQDTQVPHRLALPSINVKCSTTLTPQITSLGLEGEKARIRLSLETPSHAGNIAVTYEGQPVTFTNGSALVETILRLPETCTRTITAKSTSGIDVPNVELTLSVILDATDEVKGSHSYDLNVLAVMEASLLVDGSASTLINSGETATLEVTASGNDGPWSFMINGTTYSVASGSTWSQTVSPNTATEYVLSNVSDQCAGTTGNSTVTVFVDSHTPPTPPNPDKTLRFIKNLDTVKVACSGVTFSLAVEAENAETYKWYFNGNLINTASNPYCNVTNATSAHAGTYTVEIYRGMEKITGTACVVTVVDPISKVEFKTVPSIVYPNMTYDVEVETYDHVTNYSWSYSNKNAYFGNTANSNPAKLTTSDTHQSGTLTVRLTHVCGVVTASQNINFRATGMDDVNGTTLSLYPNPTENELNIKTDDLIESVEVRNTTGQLIFNYNKTVIVSNILKVSAGGWSPGVYMVTVKTSKDITTHKIIKK